jgi:hypothetical protein
LIAHGDIQTVVATEAGPVRSLAKMIHDNQVLIDENLASQLNPDWSEADPTKKQFIRNKPHLAQVPADVGLGQVDNTPDNAKPVSAAQAAADTAVLNSAKSYTDALVVGLWDDRGNYSAAGNVFPAAGGSGLAGAVVKGDIWTVSIAGTLGGVPVAVRQTVRALVDAPGQTALNWAIGLANTDIDDSITAGVTGRSPSQKAVFDALALKKNKGDGDTFFDKGTGAAGSTQTFDLAAGNIQRLQVGGALTIAVTGWPPAGTLGELLIELVNGAAFAATWPTINWVKVDGSTTTSFASNGVTLQSAGTDWVLLWTRNGGAIPFGKVMR